MKKYFWIVVLGVAIVVVAVFFRDISKVEELKALLRRKKVEDEVRKLEEIAAKDTNTLNKNEDMLVALAEEMKKKKVDVKNASEEDVQKFWDDFFNGE
jgi:hypothetical protein